MMDERLMGGSGGGTPYSGADAPDTVAGLRSSEICGGRRPRPVVRMAVNPEREYGRHIEDTIDYERDIEETSGCAGLAHS